MRFTVLAALLVGCAPLPPLGVTVSPARYASTMSSTVGIGLSPEFYGGQRFRYSCDYGHFASWGPPDYQVVPHGADYMTGPEKLYWTYEGGVPADRRPVTISIDAIDERGRLRSTVNVILDWDDTGGVSMRKQQ